MLDAANDAIEFAHGQSRRSLDNNRMLTLSIVKCIEIIGEAANHISPSGQTACSGIPWSDVIAMRHPLEGAARRASEATNKPIINGGDGANQHPTQTLLDLFTIFETQNKLKNLNIALVGDLKYGRTVHSLAQALVHFQCHLHLVSPESLAMPEYILKNLKDHDVPFTIHNELKPLFPKLDILYMTRIQKERFPDLLEYERVKNSYVINASQLEKVKKNFRILHPLPRVNEIHPDVDETPYAYYFEQAENGIFVRQALLALVLGKIN